MTEFNPAAQWQYDENLTLLQKQMLQALKASLCVVSTAIAMVHDWQSEEQSPTRMGKQNHYTWLESNDKYRMYYLDLKSDVKDFGESQLHTLMKGIEVVKKTTRFTKDGDTIIEEERYTTPPDKTAVIFFNKTQNKDRGYVERQELTTPEGIRIEAMAPIILNVTPSPTDESGKS